MTEEIIREEKKMKTWKKTTIAGIIISIIGAFIWNRGASALIDANKHLLDLKGETSNDYFNVGYHVNLQSEKAAEARTIITIGIIILIIGIVIVIATRVAAAREYKKYYGYSGYQYSQPAGSVSDRLNELEDLKKRGLISYAEYSERRREILGEV